MARPSKPVQLVKFEGRGHRTKAELATRERGEQALLTGRKIKEAPDVKADPDAHAEFRRVIKLLEAIQKNDSLYEAAINRYCLLRVEEQTLQRLRKNYMEQLEDFSSHFNDLVNRGELDIKTAWDMQAKLQQNFLSAEKQLSAKRKELLTIEKEHAMTIAAALRSIPKQPEKQKSALMEALGS